jgi:hypothetical protein
MNVNSLTMFYECFTKDQALVKILIQERDQLPALVNTAINMGSLNGGKSCDQLSDC